MQGLLTGVINRVEGNVTGAFLSVFSNVFKKKLQRIFR